MEYKDYYEIMGVKRDAGQEDIRRAYKKLARKYHPDVSKEANAENLFKEVGEAYEVLKDPEKRAAYDQLGANWNAGQDFQPPPEWDQGFEFRGGSFTGADAGHFSDFFDSLFGRGRTTGDFTGRSYRGFDSRGQDIYTTMLIDLEDTFGGATRTLTLSQPEAGQDGRTQQNERVLKVKIPKGVCQGQRIRLAKQGAAGFGNGEAGDLYLEIGFRPHPLYKVEGKDIFLDVPLAPWEASLGASIKVPTPSGRVDLKIPPNSSGGRKLRLKGRGIPAKQPGDLYAVLQIALPKANSDTAKRAYQALREVTEFNPRKHFGG